MNTLVRYFRYIPRSATSLTGWIIIPFASVFFLIAGFYTGPVEMTDSVYEARVLKYGVKNGRRGRGMAASIHIQGNRKLLSFGLRIRDPRYPDLVRALGAIKPNDQIMVYSVTSNYYPEQIWKFENKKAEAIFSSSREDLWREVSEHSASAMVGAKKRTLFFMAVIAIFLGSEIYGFRKNGADRIIGDSVVYKASKGHAWFLMVAMVVPSALMFKLGALTIDVRKIRVGEDIWFQLVPVVGAAVFMAFGLAFYRTSKTIKHDLVLTREGLHYPELLEKYGVEFIPWSNMRDCVRLRYCFFIHLRQPLNGEGGYDAVEIDTTRLKGLYSPVTDIEHGIHGKLFTRTNPSPQSVV